MQTHGNHAISALGALQYDFLHHCFGNKTVVENNALADIAQAQAQAEGKTPEQKAGEYVEVENERYKEANCGGMSAEACSVKMYTEWREALKETALKKGMWLKRRD